MMEVFFLFTFHLALLSVKLWALYTVLKLIILTDSPSTEKYILVFKPVEIPIFSVCLIMVAAELYFLYNFFTELDLLYYEYIAIIDQVFFTILTILYIKKEVTKNAKK